jgi:hypothetical protein
MQRALAIVSLGILCAASAVTNTAHAQDNPNQPPHIELPAPLDRVLRAYEDGWRRGDSEALASLFARDGFVLRPNHPPVRGREAIRLTYASVGGPLHLHAYAFAISDSVAHIIGGFGYDETGVDRGKYILTLRLESGRWVITADMDNANR